MLLQAALIKPTLTSGGVVTGSRLAVADANQSGDLPQGLTVYLGDGQSQSEEFPLYIATSNETVSSFNIISLTGNGAAHTDTYTVVKNGVATTMVVAITNSSTGSTTSNQVSLVSGDRVAIKIVTDAATTAADVLAQLTIIKT